MQVFSSLFILLLCSSLGLDGEFFPFVAYSDKTVVKLSRDGHSCHPVIGIPAGIERSDRRKPENKYTLMYISADADTDEAIQLLGM